MIMNEKKEAERIISGETKENKPSVIISLLSKYYIQIKKYSNSETKKLIIENLLNQFPCLNTHEWDEFINKAIKGAKKYPIKDIDKVPVTQKEIDIIKSIPTKRLQKLAFAYLIVGKYNYLINGTSWVNASFDSVMKMAGIHWTSKSKNGLDLHELLILKLISSSKKIDDIKVKIEFIDPDGEEVLGIRTFKKLGWFWDRYLKNEVKICIDCGEFFEVKGKSRRSKVRCDKCQHKTNLEKRRNIMKKSRSM